MLHKITIEKTQNCVLCELLYDYFLLYEKKQHMDVALTLNSLIAT